MPLKSTTNTQTILKEFPLFARIAAEHLAELARAARSSIFQRDQAIYRIGDPVSEMHILVTGQVKLALSSNSGTEKILDVVDAGRSFGEAELFGCEPYIADAVATRSSRVLSISRDSLFDVIARDSRIALRMMTLLAQRQIEMEAELTTRQSRSGTRRLLDFLLKLAGPQRDPLGETVVALGISKKLLAARFNIQPESLSRILRTLTESGLITVDGSRIGLKIKLIDDYLASTAAGQAQRPAASAAAAHAGRAAGEPRSLCDSINQAGRQRMLSQRMAKSWLMLERGVMPRRSRAILRQSMALFDSNLKELDRLARGAGIGSVHAELADVWRPYQALLAAEPSRGAARELFSINEEVLKAADKLTLRFERIDGTNHGKLVNLAGRERMLSQRMAKLFMFRHMGIQMPKCRRELEAADTEFSAALDEFAAVTQDTPKIAAELQKVAEYWNTMRTALAMQKDPDFAATASRVFTTSESLLRHMDTAVDLFARLPGPSPDARISDFRAGGRKGRSS